MAHRGQQPEVAQDIALVEGERVLRLLLDRGDPPWICAYVWSNWLGCEPDSVGVAA